MANSLIDTHLLIHLSVFTPQAQLVVLSTQIAWSENIDSALTTISGGGDSNIMEVVLSNVQATLNVLADTVLMEQPPLRRRKLEHLVSGNLLGYISFNRESVYNSSFAPL